MVKVKKSKSINIAIKNSEFYMYKIIQCITLDMDNAQECERGCVMQSKDFTVVSFGLFLAI